MKNPIILFLFTICVLTTHAQVGIGTTTPNSTLDVQGSLAAKTTISTATSNTLGSEYIFIFNGSSAATVTLPDASTIAGRMYTIKNSSSSTLTVNTTSSQQIDGSTSYVMGTQYQTISVVSNGTHWNIIGYGIPSGSYWALGGNSLASTQNIGTTNGYDLPIITNNTEKMRITSTGNVGIGSNSFDGIAPEKLMIDAGTTSSYNLIGAYGERNGYLQFNIQNTSDQGQASTDIVATANNGTETTNYVNLGINGGGYNNASNILSGINNGYLFSAGRNFIIGNSSASYDLLLFTGGIATGNERMRILSGGNVGIGVTNPTTKLAVAGIVAPSSDNSYTLGTSGLRWSAVHAANGTIQTSDLRLKTNIRPLQYGLKEVLNMNPVSYDWKNLADGNHKIGLIAQQIRTIIPEVVIGDERKENIGMNYAELVPVLINAIKEQQQQIEELKKKVKRLEH